MTRPEGVGSRAAGVRQCRGALREAGGADAGGSGAAGGVGGRTEWTVGKGRQRVSNS